MITDDDDSLEQFVIDEFDAAGAKRLRLTLFEDGAGGCFHTLTIPGSNCVDACETVRIPAEDDCLLRCIDANRLPHFLLDVLERWEHAKLFHAGCLLVEVDDRRALLTPRDEVLAASSKAGRRVVLLRPDALSLGADVGVCREALLEMVPDATIDDVHLLESRLIALVADDELVFDASVESAVEPSKPDLFDTLASRSYASLSRKRKAANIAFDRDWKLTKRIAAKTVQPKNERSMPPPLGASSCAGLPAYKSPVELAEAAFSAATRRGRPRPLPPFATVRREVIAVEFFVEQLVQSPDGVETFAPLATLRLLQDLADQTLRCVLEVCSAAPASGDEDEEEQMTFCKTAAGFFLGLEHDAKMYTAQYLEMITEEWRKPVRVFKRVPVDAGGSGEHELMYPIGDGAVAPPTLNRLLAGWPALGGGVSLYKY